GAELPEHDHSQLEHDGQTRVAHGRPSSTARVGDASSTRCTRAGSRRDSRKAAAEQPAEARTVAAGPELKSTISARRSLQSGGQQAVRVEQELLCRALIEITVPAGRVVERYHGG